jgi:hypothetical protein
MRLAAQRPDRPPDGVTLPGSQRLPETALAPRPATVVINSAEI